MTMLPLASGSTRAGMVIVVLGVLYVARCADACQYTNDVDSSTGCCTDTNSCPSSCMSSSSSSSNGFSSCSCSRCNSRPPPPTFAPTPPPTIKILYATIDGVQFECDGRTYTNTFVPQHTASGACYCYTNPSNWISPLDSCGKNGVQCTMCSAPGTFAGSTALQKYKSTAPCSKFYAGVMYNQNKDKIKFQCSDFSKCVNAEYINDKSNDCNDGSDEGTSSAYMATCSIADANTCLDRRCQCPKGQFKVTTQTKFGSVCWQCQSAAVYSQSNFYSLKQCPTGCGKYWCKDVTLVSGDSPEYSDLHLCSKRSRSLDHLAAIGSRRLYTSDFRGGTYIKYPTQANGNTMMSPANPNDCCNPTKAPTRDPTRFPTRFPTPEPTYVPTLYPTSLPTPTPTATAAPPDSGSGGTVAVIVIIMVLVLLGGAAGAAFHLKKGPFAPTDSKESMYDRNQPGEMDMDEINPEDSETASTK